MSHFGHLTAIQLGNVPTPTDRATVTEIFRCATKLKKEGIWAAARHIERLCTPDQLLGFFDHVRPYLLKQLDGLFLKCHRVEIEALPPYMQLDVLFVGRCCYGNMHRHLSKVPGPTRTRTGFRKKLMGFDDDNQDIQDLSVSEMVKRIKLTWAIPENKAMFELVDSEQLQWVFNAQPVVVNNTLAKMALQLYLVGVHSWHCSNMLDREPYPMATDSWQAGIGLAAVINWAVQSSGGNMDQKIDFPIDVVSGRPTGHLGPAFHGAMQVHSFLNIFRVPVFLMECGSDRYEKVRVFRCMIARLQAWMGVDVRGAQVLTFIEAARIILFVRANLFVSLPAADSVLDWSGMTDSQGTIALARAIVAYVKR